MKMQALSIEKGFMVGDDLQTNMDDIAHTHTDLDGNCDKVKMIETDFSVERLLAHTEKGKILSSIEKEQKENLTDLESKIDKTEKQTNLDIGICEFESLSNEDFQSSKMELFEDLEEQIQPPSSETLTEAKPKRDHAILTETKPKRDGSVKETVTVSVDKNDPYVRSCDENMNNERIDLKSESLKIDKLNHFSDESEDASFNSKTLVDVHDSKENLMRFAEVLYKCTLCTSIPSILTSEESFTKHITEQHLTHQQSFVDCPQCLLKFQTDEDLKEHKQLTHNTGSDLTEDSEIQDYTESDVVSYDQDPLDRDDSDSHSSGHRSNTFVFTKPEETKQFSSTHTDFSGAKFNKDGITTYNGSLDLSLKSEHKADKNIKHETSASGITPNKNLPLLHQITDQIVKSSTPSRNKFENQRPIEFTPSYTPEFGKYTKLVREGGNIVYFCQVCNWKSPVKATFSVHCGIADHKRKVIMAERSEKGKSCEIDVSKISPMLMTESISKKTHTLSTDMTGSRSKEPIGWNPRGGASCLSLLSEPSGFYIGSKTGPIKSRNELSPYKTLDEKSHSVHRRKKSLMNSVRHQMRLKPKWSDTDSDDDDNDHNNKHEKHDKSSSGQSSEAHREGLTLESVKHLKDLEETSRALTDHQSTDTENKSSPVIDLTLIKKENVGSGSESFQKDIGSHAKFHRHLGEPTEKKPKLSPHSETSIQNLIDKHVLENIKSNNDIIVFKLYKCHLCDFEYSDPKEYGKHFEEFHKLVDSKENLDIEPSVKKNNDRSNTGTPNVELGEHWRVQKLKEMLPEFVKVNSKSNTSRDLLLQRMSSTSGITDMVGWSSACNKAMREIFPSSLAQRKGKFKKTFYFGVSLMDEASLDEDLNVSDFVGDPESLSYQPIRDLNVDIEKLLEHLPTILMWTGDMDKGVYRDDVLLNLADSLDEPDIKYWGKQCNKAIRVVFPNVEIKRKGKDKTVYFGLDFYDYSHSQHFHPKLAGRPKKIDLDTSENSSPLSKKPYVVIPHLNHLVEMIQIRSHNTQNSPDTEQPLNLASSWTSPTSHDKSQRVPEGGNSSELSSGLKDKYLSEESFQVDEYLAKFGGVSMFDSNDEDNDELVDDKKCADSDNDQNEISVT